MLGIQAKVEASLGKVWKLADVVLNVHKKAAPYNESLDTTYLTCTYYYSM